MRKRKFLPRLLVFAAIVFVTQYLFIAYLPNLIFAIAKYHSHEPLNTVIYAPKTNAKLRKVVLPNPDFIYNACFYDASEKDILITGEFPDSTQYSSLAFYGNNVQPYYVKNNQVGMKSRFKIRLSSVGRIHSDVRTPTKQGAVLMRILVTDSAQLKNALALQKTFRVDVLDQNE
jgi:uncharacterized membrane protein